MKRLLFLSMCILLIGAPMVNAEIIQVDATRTAYDATFDKVVLTIVGFEGTDVPASGYCLLSMLGTWTNDGGLNLSGTPTTWTSRTLNNGNGQDTDTLYPRQSWVNFSSKTSDATARVAGGAGYRSFTEGMYGSASDVNGFGLSSVDATPGEGGETDGYYFDNTLLGVFYIAHADTSWVPGATIWTGSGGFAKIGGGGATGTINGLSVAIVPEPSTLALLGCGLFGLLAYAWRKRK